MSQSNDAEPVYLSVNYLNADRGVWSWLSTLDHKRIGIMYLVSVLLAFLLGGIFAMALRIEHLTPEPTIMSAKYRRTQSSALSMARVTRVWPVATRWSVARSSATDPSVIS